MAWRNIKQLNGNLESEGLQALHHTFKITIHTHTHKVHHSTEYILRILYLNSVGAAQCSRDPSVGGGGVRGGVGWGWGVSRGGGEAGGEGGAVSRHGCGWTGAGQTTTTGCLYKLSPINLVWGALKCSKSNFNPVHVFLYFKSFCLVVLKLILASKLSELQQFANRAANNQG